MSEHAGVTASGRAVTLNFPAPEYAARLAATRAELNRRGPSALLVLAQENHYYLTGFDTAGYVFLQAGIVTADDRPSVLLIRRPELQQAGDASRYDDIRIWLNAEDANPALELRAILSELGLAGSRIGVEFATYGLTAANGRMLEAALSGFAILEDASDIVRCQRLVKSPAWMDVPPMIYTGNPLVMEPGMVFFDHIMIPDRRTGLTADVGQTFAITEDAPATFSMRPLRLHLC